MRHQLLALAVLLAGLAALPALADRHDEEEIPFSVADVYFELNDTDGDLGIHALIDGEPWKKLEIEGPDEEENLEIRLSGGLRSQGLTELFFESAEPSFDELDPEEFFERFPEGEYEIEGTTIEGDELESIAIVTHLIPTAPDVAVNGEDLPEDCDEDPVPEVSAPFTVSWDPIFLSHPEIGRTNEPIEVVKYELVVEREEGEPLKMTFDLSPDVTEVTLPPGFLEPGDELKVEVLVRESSGNQSATESCFAVEE